MNIYRYKNNPILTPKDVKPHRKDFEVIGAFNAAMARYKNEIIMLLRVAERPVNESPDKVKAPVYNAVSGKIEILELNKSDNRYDFSDPREIKDNIKKDGSFIYLTSISYLRIARSTDGIHFTVDDKPLVYPSDELEVFGVEDPRITEIDGVYYIYFSAVSPAGIGEMMVKTTDFKNVERCGMIFAPENKDVVIFPEKIQGKYYALHRPTPKATGNPEIWIAESDNLIYWGKHRHLMGIRRNMWDSQKIGSGAVPFRTEKGWLELYHGVDYNDVYGIGAVLFDINDPCRILARSSEPVMKPEMEYEINGFFGNVVFSCGAVADGDIIKLYYGVSDTSMAYAELSINEILNSLKYI